MKDLVRHKAFIFSFLLSYFGYFLLTVVILEVRQPQIGAGNAAYGYPFVYLYTSCYGGYYSYLGLLGNILFAAVLGTIVGLLFSYLWKNLFVPAWTKVTSDEFRTKYHL